MPRFFLQTEAGFRCSSFSFSYQKSQPGNPLRSWAGSAALAPRRRDKHFPADIQAPELGQVLKVSPVLSLPLKGSP